MQKTWWHKFRKGSIKRNNSLLLSYFRRRQPRIFQYPLNNCKDLPTCLREIRRLSLGLLKSLPASNTVLLLSHFCLSLSLFAFPISLSSFTYSHPLSIPIFRLKTLFWISQCFSREKKNKMMNELEPVWCLMMFAADSLQLPLMQQREVLYREDDTRPPSKRKMKRE